MTGMRADVYAKLQSAAISEIGNAHKLEFIFDLPLNHTYIKYGIIVNTCVTTYVVDLIAILDSNWRINGRKCRKRVFRCFFNQN